MNARFLSLTLGLITAAAVSAATYYVAPAGDDINPGNSMLPWATIQHAVNTAGSTDTVLVAGGTYVENVVITGPNTLTLKGGHDAGTWSWTPAATPSIIQAANAALDCIDLQTSYNTITGLTLTGGRYGIWCRYGSNATQTVTHCIAKANSSHGIYVTGHGGKTALDASNCLVVSNGGHGIYINVDHAAVESHIYNCTIADNALSGYRDEHYYHRPTHLKNCIIANNGEYGIRHSGGYIYTSTAANNCVYGNAAGNISIKYAFYKLRLDGGNLAGNPAFVGGGDYTLTAVSPCIEYGQDLSGDGVTDDIIGAARAGAYDMGCYESGLSAAARYAATYADAAGDDANAGTSAGAAKKTIGAALAITAAGGTCNVAAGSYSEDPVVDLPDLTISGAGAGTTTLTALDRIGVWLDSTGGVVGGVTVTGGEVGVLMGGPVSIDNTVERSVIDGNDYGVYGLNENVHRRYIVDRCEVTGNGSGIYNYGGKCAVDVRNSLVALNTLHGIYQQVDHSNYESNAYNCTLADNGGNGWHSHNYYQHKAYVRNCMITGNLGVGLYHGGGYVYSQLHLSYTDIFGNGTDTVAVNPTHLIVESGVISAAPLYAGGYNLGAGSPGIDAGTDLSGDGILVDIAGTARPIGAAYDIGAYESTASAAVLYPDTYVDGTGGSDSNAGNTAAAAKQTISAALAVTDVGGTCHVLTGTYAGPVTVPGTITLEGAGASLVTLTDPATVVALNEADATIRGFTISGGANGVMVNAASTTTAADDSNTLIADCVITGNGKAVTVPGSGNRRVNVSRCDLSNNDYGVYISGGKSAVGLVNCLVTGNSLGGVYVNVDHSPFDSYAYNCTIADNTGDGWRTNHYYQRPAYVRNCLITGNSGVGLYHGGGYVYSYLYLSNSDLSGNGTNYVEAVAGHLVIGGGMISAAPVYTGTYNLDNGSPAIDAGADLTTTDLAGVSVTDDIAGTARPIGAAYDMGAYESTAAAAVKYPDTYVDGSGGNDANDGDTPATAKQTIAAALAVTDTGGTCHILPGTYTGAITVPGTVTLRGAGPDLVTLTDAGTVVTLNEAGSTIADVTITGAVNGVLVTAASTTTGTDDSNTLVEHCVIEGNTYGVTVPNSGQRRIYVSRSELTGNDYGVYVSGGKTSIGLDNDLIAGNTFDGVYVNVDHAQFNSWAYNCTIADNGRDGWRTQHYYQYPAYVRNCIITGNAQYGIYHGGGYGYSYLYLSYSDLQGNGTDYFSAVAGHIVVELGVISAAPQFAGVGDYQLGDLSPAINAGTDLSGVGVVGDLAGDPRPALGGWDMGAYELQNRNPDAVCQDVTVTLDSNGEASITAAQVDDGSSDPDGDTVGLQLDQTDLTCADAPSTTVELTVTDGNGGSDSCTATVTVQTAGTCAEVTDAVYDLVCESGDSFTNGAEAQAAIEAAWATALGSSTVCDVPAASCLAAILAAAGL